MGFDRRDIRPAMDVYTRDNVYLGAVRAVIPGPTPTLGDPGPRGARESSAVSGEALGPSPTRAIGNRGPDTQSARAAYATAPDGARPLGVGALIVGRWWGLVGRRTIPLDAVQTVSLERVILNVPHDQLPDGAGR